HSAGTAPRAAPGTIGAPPHAGASAVPERRGRAGAASVGRLREAYPKAILVHTPVHASWLNQVEIYFSLLQRKVLTPNDFSSLAEVERRLRLYEELSNRTPRPFQWKFDRAKLAELLSRLEAKQALRAGDKVVTM